MSISKKTRYIVFERDNHTCQYCGRNIKEDNVKLEVDHIIPKSRGSSDEISNLVTSCFDCNRGKKDFLNYSKISIENITPEIAYEILPIIQKMMIENTEEIENKKEYTKQLLKNLDRIMGIFNIKKDKHNTCMPFYKFITIVEEKFKEYAKNNFTSLSSNNNHLQVYKKYHNIESDKDVAMKLIKGEVIPNNYMKKHTVVW